MIIPVGKRCGQPALPRPASTLSCSSTPALTTDGRPAPSSALNPATPSSSAAPTKKSKLSAPLPSPSKSFPASPPPSPSPPALKPRSPTATQPRNSSSPPPTMPPTSPNPSPGRAPSRPSRPWSSTCPAATSPALSASLIRAGIAPETPVAAVSKASTPFQHVVSTTVATLASAQPGPAPLLLLIGRAIQLPKKM